jgi:hypothetical protein
VLESTCAWLEWRRVMPFTAIVRSRRCGVSARPSPSVGRTVPVMN